MTNHLGALDCPSFRTESPLSRETPQPRTVAHRRAELLSVGTMTFGTAHSRSRDCPCTSGCLRIPPASAHSVPVACPGCDD